MVDPITKSIIVKGNIVDIFRVWADFENFPRFMAHIKSVEKVDDRLSRWVMQGPVGTSIEWEAETTMFEPNRRIGWNSRDRSPIKTSGQVLFTDLRDDETEVTVTLKYEPPVDLVANTKEALFANVDRRLEEDLRSFKRYVEAAWREAHAR